MHAAESLSHAADDVAVRVFARLHVGDEPGALSCVQGRDGGALEHRHAGAFGDGVPVLDEQEVLAVLDRTAAAGEDRHSVLSVERRALEQAAAFDDDHPAAVREQTSPEVLQHPHRQVTDLEHLTHVEDDDAHEVVESAHSAHQ